MSSRAKFSWGEYEVFRWLSRNDRIAPSVHTACRSSVKVPLPSRRRSVLLVVDGAQVLDLGGPGCEVAVPEQGELLDEGAGRGGGPVGPARVDHALDPPLAELDDPRPHTAVLCETGSTRQGGGEIEDLVDGVCDLTSCEVVDLAVESGETDPAQQVRRIVVR